MKTLEWKNVDKSAWKAGRGPWDAEPDKKQWTDEATGLPCLIVRGPSGALCGYVGVSQGHPHFEQSYWGVDVEVHGGLTFADHCCPHPEDEGRGICHLVEDGDDDNVWWLGFDCAHSGDTCPKYDREGRFAGYWHESYKTWGYVEGEVKSLARQLKAMITPSLLEPSK